MHQVLQLQRLDAGGVEHIALIANANIVQTLDQRFDFFHPLPHHLLVAEHAAMFFHHLLELVAQITDRFTCRTGFALPAVEPLHRSLHAAFIQRLVITMLVQVFNDMVGCGAAEHQNIQQRIAAQPVGAMH